MKRFYCTVCKRVKRVRKLPMHIARAESSNVFDRQGVCNRHLIAQPRKTGTR